MIRSVLVGQRALELDRRQRALGGAAPSPIGYHTRAVNDGQICVQSNCCHQALDLHTREPHTTTAHMDQMRRESYNRRGFSLGCVSWDEQEKNMKSNQTNHIYNYSISQLQIIVLKYLKMVGWIG